MAAWSSLVQEAAVDLQQAAPTDHADQTPHSDAAGPLAGPGDVGHWPQKPTAPPAGAALPGQQPSGVNLRNSLQQADEARAVVPGAPPLAGEPPSVLDALRMTQRRLGDLREQLHLYRILKADSNQALDGIVKLPRDQPGGVPWARAYSLQQHVEETKDEPNETFDGILGGMDHAQQDMLTAIKLSQQELGDEQLMTRRVTDEASQATLDAARLLGGRLKDSCGRGALTAALLIPQQAAASPRAGRATWRSFF
eukprot:TRINITY_DN46852_c0_g1_i1.p1 TRINITY_DN46852_c0_g1~~TRINITY_DN46852_c0_g1_i1.p1  ORF type:complete len:253 (+),score=56.17 TRINITY_DN46852_c0_g1_i1:91-849(+)